MCDCESTVLSLNEGVKEDHVVITLGLRSPRSQSVMGMFVRLILIQDVVNDNLKIAMFSVGNSRSHVRVFLLVSPSHFQLD